MLVLGIDTTSVHGGVAIYRDRECLASLVNTGTSAFSVTLFQLVDRALGEAGARLSGAPLALRDIGLFAAANGPGSFTGIRTGLAAVQGWATALGKPVAGVSCMAAMVHLDCPETPSAVVLMDAHRGEFYLGLFRRDAESLPPTFSPEGEGRVMMPEVLVTLLEERQRSGAVDTVVFRTSDAAAQAFIKTLAQPSRSKQVPDFLAGSVSQLALDAHIRGRSQAPADLDALYIRRSDAELNWRS